MNDRCIDCRYRRRSALEAPCNTGIYQIRYSGRCFCHKPMHWWQRVIDIKGWLAYRCKPEEEHHVWM